MKGIQGLIIALGLGVAGAMFNWAYLTSRSRDLEKVSFVGIKPEMTVNKGEVLREEDLVPVGIPKQAVGNLDKFAVLYDNRQTVIGSSVARNIGGGGLLLNEDLKTPPMELKLEANEAAMWVPVDTRAFLPSLVVPGDQVSFLVPRSMPGSPTLAKPAGMSGVAGVQGGEEDGIANNFDVIGPFKILSLGNRLGSADVMKAAGIPQTQENVLTVGVHLTNGKPEAKALYLRSLLEATNYRQVGVILHSREDK